MTVLGVSLVKNGHIVGGGHIVCAERNRINARRRIGGRGVERPVICRLYETVVIYVVRAYRAAVYGIASVVGDNARFDRLLIRAFSVCEFRQLGVEIGGIRRFVAFVIRRGFVKLRHGHFGDVYCTRRKSAVVVFVVVHSQPDLEIKFAYARIAGGDVERVLLIAVGLGGIIERIAAVGILYLAYGGDFLIAVFKHEVSAVAAYIGNAHGNVDALNGICGCAETKRAIADRNAVRSDRHSALVRVDDEQVIGYIGSVRNVGIYILGNNRSVAVGVGTLITVTRHIRRYNAAYDVVGIIFVIDVGAHSRRTVFACRHKRPV